jgi:hypothetical protein
MARMSEGPIRGSCLCGGVPFELTGPPLWTSWCHCTRCRKAGAMANVLVQAEPFRLLRWRELALDDDPGARPVLHEHVAEKAPWYEMLDGLPQFPGHPPRPGSE